MAVVVVIIYNVVAIILEENVHTGEPVGGCGAFLVLIDVARKLVIIGHVFNYICNKNEYLITLLSNIFFLIFFIG